MKGIIFNVVEDAVVAEHGEDAWESVLDAAGLDGSWTSVGMYPDEDLLALVDAGSTVLGVPRADLLRHLGHVCLLGLARRYPQFLEPHEATRPFLLTLNEVIHPEVRKLHPDARPPEFWFDETDPDTLLMHYESSRRLCLLAEGMVQGAASCFGERASVTQLACVHEGADRCVLAIGFERI
jgi:hypothetical protein